MRVKTAWFKFGEPIKICQTAKLKSPPNKPHIRYISGYLHKSVRVNHLNWLWRGWLLYLVIRFSCTTNCSLALLHYLYSIYFLIDIIVYYSVGPFAESLQWLVELATVSRSNDKTDLSSWEWLNYMHTQISCTNITFFEYYNQRIKPCPFSTAYIALMGTLMHILMKYSTESAHQVHKSFTLKKRFTMHAYNIKSSFLLWS